MVHRRLHPPLTRPATCSSTWISALAALCSLSRSQHVGFFLAEAGVAGVLGIEHPLPIADLSHRSPGPANV